MGMNLSKLSFLLLLQKLGSFTAQNTYRFLFIIKLKISGKQTQQKQSRFREISLTKYYPKFESRIREKRGSGRFSLQDFFLGDEAEFWK